MPAPRLVATPSPSPALLPPALLHADSLRAAVEQRLAALLPMPRGPGDRVAHAMREAVLSPGKRFRPLLVLTGCRALQVDPAAFFDVACALEIVHAASLTLDDMPCMDNALLRRGRPALHHAFGEDVALLAAVAQLSLAYRIVAASPSLAPALRVHVALAVADGIDDLVQGQYRDLHAGASADDGEAAAGAAETVRLKTASLFGVAFEIAALAAGRNAEFRARLQSCAAHIGQAFQLLDDLQDGGCLPARDGTRPVNEDGGKVTLVTLLRPAGANARFRMHVRTADAMLRSLFPEGDAMCELLQQVFGGHEEVVLE